MSYRPTDILSVEFIRSTFESDLGHEPKVQEAIHAILLGNALSPPPGGGEQSDQDLITRRFYIQRCRNFLEHGVGFRVENGPPATLEAPVSAAAYFCFYSWQPQLLKETKDLLAAYIDAGYMTLNGPVNQTTNKGARIRGASLFEYALVHDNRDLLKAVMELGCDFNVVPGEFRAQGLVANDVVGYATMLHGNSSKACLLVKEAVMRRAMNTAVPENSPDAHPTRRRSL